MSQFIGSANDEKKVEYIELIFDLIFVYIVGRNNSLLHSVENGFISADIYLTYILTTLIALHIWYFTTIFINRHGSGGAAEYIGLFITMYLLYYMADGTRVDWQDYYVRYNTAWALIMLNLAVQYMIKLKKNGGLRPWEDAQIKKDIRNLIIEAAVIFASIPLFFAIKIPLSPVAMIFGVAAAAMTRRANLLRPMDFSHLTERVMLYVVFSFGEMIIGISGYFEGGINLNNIYFSTMSFLIVTGLFLSYGFVYDHLIDREKRTSGSGYMIIHVFLITALNNLTVALEFMREPQISAMPKNIFLVASFLVYFMFLFLLENYSKEELRASGKFYIKLIVSAAAFTALMALFYQSGRISIAVTVAFVFSVYVILRLFEKNKKAAVI
ncbi:MAG: low temperature requirement protein A [Clostridia bacterium]|nr:low temperature requirement protein A [Clostridia bacterium]